VQSTVDNGDGTFTITYTDGSTFTSSPFSGADTNLATDNLTQDPETRTYNLNGQALGLTNGSTGFGTNTPNSTVQITGTFSLSIRATSTNTTLGASDYTLVLNSGGLTLTLPAASTCQGRIYILKNVANADSYTSLNFISEDGALENRVIKSRIYWLQSDGVNWQQINTD